MGPVARVDKLKHVLRGRPYIRREEFMDLRVFYQKMRKIEQEITSDHPVVVSLETPDGGKPGIRTEVTRENAARMIVEGRCRLATKSETAEYLKQFGPEAK